MLRQINVIRIYLALVYADMKNKCFPYYKAIPRK